MFVRLTNSSQPHLEVLDHITQHQALLRTLNTPRILRRPSEQNRFKGYNAPIELKEFKRKPLPVLTALSELIRENWELTEETQLKLFQ